MRSRNPLSTFGGLILLIALLVGMTTAAGMTVHVDATGDTVFGDTCLEWSISDGSMIGTPPLFCGQEIVTGVSSERFLTTGGSSYESTLDVQNTDIVRMDVQTTISSTGPGYYENALLLSGFGAGAPEGGCDSIAGSMVESSTDTTSANETPAEDSFCNSMLVETSLGGSMMQYQRSGGINAWASDVPDELSIDFTGSVNGIGRISIESISMTGNGGGPGVLGYENSISSRIRSIGDPATIGGIVRWTSFNPTFFTPQEGEPTQQET